MSDWFGDVARAILECTESDVFDEHVEVRDGVTVHEVYFKPDAIKAITFTDDTVVWPKVSNERGTGP